MIRVGIDLGGTKIEGIALDRGREILRRRIPTPRHDYDATLRAILQMIHDLEAAAGAPATIGVGIPGTISPATRLVKNANSTWLIGRPLQDDLERVLGRHVRIANDANCFAASEAADGAGAGAEVVCAVIVGTGTGAGIAVHGRVLTGRHGIAGEWGHNPLPWAEADEWPGPPCYCGRTGCIETFLSGPALAADYSARHAPRSGAGAPAAEDVVAMADGGDPEALAAVQRYERRMARALASLINVLDPDVIVLGGGMSKVSRLYQTVPTYWREFVFACGAGERILTRLLPPAHGDASGVRGAAWLWNDE